MIDGDSQAIGIKTPFLRGQAPGQLNRALFKIISEREIAQHFKKCVVARGIAHIIKVIMLAASAYAFLR